MIASLKPAKPEANGITSRTVVVILAAGKGTRMGRSDLAKVCFEIDGVAAINRAIRTFRKLGFASFLLVVGSNAEQVMDKVAEEHGAVAYVYQSPQLGTGHAARFAADTLQAIGHQGPILITMGDKFIEPEAIERLRDGFIRQNADLALATVARTRQTEGSGGRILTDERGHPLAIIETSDLARQAIADELSQKLQTATDLPAAELEQLLRQHLPAAGKQETAVPQLRELAQRGGIIPGEKLRAIIQSRQYSLTINGRDYSAGEIEQTCRSLNPSLYYFKANPFYHGVSMLDNDNAQGEYYLTDIVRHLATDRAENRDKYQVRLVELPTPDCLQGFNSPDELIRIQDYLRNRKQKTAAATCHPAATGLSEQLYCPVRQWIEKIETGQPNYRRWQNNIYGNHPGLHQKKSADLLRLLECYGQRFSFSEKVCLVRAPGRVNLMGRHVDHRGGYNNFLAIHKETMAVVGPRSDDRLLAVNLDPQSFAPVDFSLTELIGRFGWTDWLNFINSDWVRSMLRSNPGDWGNYIKAAILRLQHHYQDLRLNGLNMALHGDIPMAAGLSSSSSIVVATLKAAIALNQLELNAQQFIDLCGQGEWFVGSRGGSGDHAAIYLGQPNKITQVAYLPFRIEQVFEAPSDYQVIIADSHIKAAKSGPAREQFNLKIAAYNLAFALLKQRCPEYRDLLHHIRDLNPKTLGCRPSRIYQMLASIPQSMTRQEIRAALNRESSELLEENFASHQDPGQYELRGVLLFGAAEIARSLICPQLIKQGRLEEFGQLMKISHDGDRVCRADPNGHYSHLADPCSDRYLNGLRGELASECAQRVAAAQLQMQPGYYACSTPQLDRMVDLASQVPGVVGAQIAGAGLGGCIMILARREAVDKVRQILTDDYYKNQNLKPSIIPCVTTQGASLASF